MLLKDVFRDYHREARPVLNKEDAVKVELDVAYSQLVELVRKKCLYIAELHRVLCFDRSVVTLAFFQKNISHPTFPSLRFSGLDQCFRVHGLLVFSLYPRFASYCEYRISSYFLS